MDIKVLSRKLIYIDGKRIRRKRLVFDGYMSHCRDVFVSGEIVIKIDEFDHDDPDHKYESFSQVQCKTEMKIWNKLRPTQRIWFAKPIAHGHFIEDGFKVHWLAQKVEYPDKIKIKEDHKDWERFEKLADSLNITDVFDDERNCFVNIFGNLVCVDWGV